MVEETAITVFKSHLHCDLDRKGVETYRPNLSKWISVDRCHSQHRERVKIDCGMLLAGTGLSGK